MQAERNIVSTVAATQAGRPFTHSFSPLSCQNGNEKLTAISTIESIWGIGAVKAENLVSVIRAFGEPFADLCA